MIWLVVGTIGIVAITIVAGVLLDRKIGILPRPEKLRALDKPRGPTYAPGEVPATAISTTAARLANLRASQRCTSCRGPAVADSEERVRYGDHELIVLRFRCTRCGESRPLYIAPAE
jgi:hypothetical protein